MVPGRRPMEVDKLTGDVTLSLMVVGTDRQRDLDLDGRVSALRARAVRPTGDRLAPPPQWRGAPDVPTWRNPTAWLLAAALASWAFGWVGHLSGALPASAAIVANALGAYLGFTVFHESVHRTAHRRRWVNDAMGWLPALMLTFTYPVFRICHLQHHAHTNDPELDPDHSVARRPGWLRPLWLLWTAVNYRRLCRRHRWGSDGQRRAQLLLDVVLVASLPLALVAGVADHLLVLYWAPAALAGAVLFYAFDYLPHHPHDRTERFHDTRVQPGGVRHAVLLAQNYHLVHHLWVSVPWFRYRAVYRELEPQLLAKGIRADLRRPLSRRGRGSAPSTG